jgi:hypothetical protein
MQGLGLVPGKGATVRLTIVMTLVMLTGCATSQVEPVAVDTWCLSARKRTWSINDTPETIRDAEAHNRAVDLRCGVPGQVKS